MTSCCSTVHRSLVGSREDSQCNQSLLSVVVGRCEQAVGRVCVRYIPLLQEEAVFGILQLHPVWTLQEETEVYHGYRYESTHLVVVLQQVALKCLRERKLRLEGGGSGEEYTNSSLLTRKRGTLSKCRSDDLNCV